MALHQWNISTVSESGDSARIYVLNNKRIVVYTDGDELYYRINDLAPKTLRHTSSLSVQPLSFKLVHGFNSLYILCSSVQHDDAVLFSLSLLDGSISSELLEVGLPSYIGIGTLNYRPIVACTIGTQVKYWHYDDKIAVDVDVEISGNDCYHDICIFSQNRRPMIVGCSSGSVNGTIGVFHAVDGRPGTKWSKLSIATGYKPVGKSFFDVPFVAYKKSGGTPGLYFNMGTEITGTTWSGEKTVIAGTTIYGHDINFVSRILVGFTYYDSDLTTATLNYAYVDSSSNWAALTTIDTEDDDPSLLTSIFHKDGIAYAAFIDEGVVKWAWYDLPPITPIPSVVTTVETDITPGFEYNFKYSNSSRINDMNSALERNGAALPRTDTDKPVSEELHANKISCEDLVAFAGALEAGFRIKRDCAPGSTTSLDWLDYGDIPWPLGIDDTKRKMLWDAWKNDIESQSLAGLLDAINSTSDPVLHDDWVPVVAYRSKEDTCKVAFGADAYPDSSWAIYTIDEGAENEKTGFWTDIVADTQSEYSAVHVFYYSIFDEDLADTSDNWFTSHLPNKGELKHCFIETKPSGELDVHTPETVAGFTLGEADFGRWVSATLVGSNIWLAYTEFMVGNDLTRLSDNYQLYVQPLKGGGERVLVDGLETPHTDRAGEGVRLFHINNATGNKYLVVAYYAMTVPPGLPDPIPILYLRYAYASSADGYQTWSTPQDLHTYAPYPEANEGYSTQDRIGVPFGRIGLCEVNNGTEDLPDFMPAITTVGSQGVLLFRMTALDEPVFDETPVEISMAGYDNSNASIDIDSLVGTVIGDTPSFTSPYQLYDLGDNEGFPEAPEGTKNVSVPMVVYMDDVKNDGSTVGKVKMLKCSASEYTKPEPEPVNCDDKEFLGRLGRLGDSTGMNWCYNHHIVEQTMIGGHHDGMLFPHYYVANRDDFNSAWKDAFDEWRLDPANIEHLNDHHIHIAYSQCPLNIDKSSLSGIELSGDIATNGLKYLYSAVWHPMGNGILPMPKDFAQSDPSIVQWSPSYTVDADCHPLSHVSICSAKVNVAKLTPLNVKEILDAVETPISSEDLPPTTGGDKPLGEELRPPRKISICPPVTPCEGDTEKRVITFIADDAKSADILGQLSDTQLERIVKRFSATSILYDIHIKQGDFIVKTTTTEETVVLDEEDFEGSVEPVVIVDNGGSVDISWEDVDADVYEIIRDNETHTPIAVVSSTTYTDTTPVGGKRVYFIRPIKYG